MLLNLSYLLFATLAFLVMEIPESECQLIQLPQEEEDPCKTTSAKKFSKVFFPDPFKFTSAAISWTKEDDHRWGNFTISDGAIRGLSTFQNVTLTEHHHPLKTKYFPLFALTADFKHLEITGEYEFSKNGLSNANNNPQREEETYFPRQGQLNVSLSGVKLQTILREIYRSGEFSVESNEEATLSMKEGSARFIPNDSVAASPEEKSVEVEVRALSGVAFQEFLGLLWQEIRWVLKGEANRELIRCESQGRRLTLKDIERIVATT